MPPTVDEGRSRAYNEAIYQLELANGRDVGTFDRVDPGDDVNIIKGLGISIKCGSGVDKGKSSILISSDLDDDALAMLAAIVA